MQQSLALEGRFYLVVEDEYLAASSMMTALEDEGAEVAGPVSNVAGALQLVRDARPNSMGRFSISICAERWPTRSPRSSPNIRSRSFLSPATSVIPCQNLSRRCLASTSRAMNKTYWRCSRACQHGSSGLDCIR